MLKRLFVTVFMMASVLAQSAPFESQAIADQIVAAFSSNNLRLTEPSKLSTKESLSILDPQAPFTANLGRINLNSFTAPTLSFNDSKTLNLVVDQGLLNELTETGAVAPNADGSLHMTSEAKSRLRFGAVNLTGIVEARSVIIQNGVVILTGR